MLLTARLEGVREGIDGRRDGLERTGPGSGFPRGAIASATTFRPPAAAARSAIATLLPIIAVVPIAFLVIGLALPVLSLHVHQGLGLGTFVVGLVAGSQFAASFISRLWSGHCADSRGAKRAVVVGVPTAAVSGLL